MKCLPLSGLFLLIFLFSSCNDKTEDPAPVEETGIAIQSLEITSKVDLSGREGWTLEISGCEYDYTTDQRQIRGKPANKLAYLDKSYAEGSQIPLGKGPFIRLIPPGETKTKMAMPPMTQDQDQSTPEKLFAADILYADYSGKASGHLSGLELTHQNAFIEFEGIDFPVDARVEVESRMKIIPYQEGNIFQAIVLAGQGAQIPSVTIKANGKIHELSLDKYVSLFIEATSSSIYTPRDTYFQFVVRYNPEEDTFSMDDFVHYTWSEEDHPSQLKLVEKYITEFKMFIGSPEGGVEVSTYGMNPEQFWGGRLNSYPRHIRFNEEDQTITRIPAEHESNIFTYTFIGDSLYRYNPNVENWYFAGKGNKEELHYHMGYYRAKYYDEEFRISRFYIAQDNEPATASGFQIDLHSLESLKQETDTIVWCNINYIYKQN